MVVAITGVAAGITAMHAQQPLTDVAEVDMAATTTNLTSPEFQASARMRRPTNVSDPKSRIEVISQSGRTTVEVVANGHRASATIEVVKSTQPDIISGIGGPGDTVGTLIVLRVDGCEIDLPPGMSSFSDPRAVSLRPHGRSWAFEITNNGDSEAYMATYIFDAKSLVSQHLVWGGSYDADWRIARDLYGEPRDCQAVGPRRFGARAEVALPSE